MSALRYTEEEIQLFLEAAQEIGVGPAMRDLGYPKSPSTAWDWVDKYDVQVNIDTLKQHASHMKVFYAQREKLVVAMSALDRIYEALTRENLSADDQKKLSDALQKTIQTIELLEGRVTDRTETVAKDSVDAELQELIAEARARNTVFEEDNV